MPASNGTELDIVASLRPVYSPSRLGSAFDREIVCVSSSLRGIEWDKDDIDILKFMKVDCLALGMLSCMKQGFDLLADYSAGGSALLCDDEEGRHARYIPDREPGADVDAAADQAADHL